MLDGINLFQLLGRELGGQRIEALSQNSRRGCAELLSGGQRLKGHAIPCARPLLEHCEDIHMTRASNRSFSTSFAAASLGLPSNNCVRLVRSGRCKRSMDTLEGPAVAPRPAGVSRLTSL